MQRVIGILAHVDAGKTTFSEQVLYHAGAIRKRGRVDHQNAFLDNQSIERERGITVFAEQATFSLCGCQYHWIDTPGHADFSAEMERALQVMDAAVVLVSGVEGVQGHTETVFQLLRNNGVPCFFFINKLDRSGASFSGTISEIQRTLAKEAVRFDQLDGGEGERAFAEKLAELDDDLLERYLDGGYQREYWMKEAGRMLKEGRLFPVFGGSALQDQGVEEFLKAMHDLLSWISPPDPDSPFCGLVYKIRHDKQGKRVAFLKVTKGVLRAKQQVSVLGEEGEPALQKIDELRIYNGERFATVQQVEPGGLCGVVGLSLAAPGDGVGAEHFRQSYETVPTMMAKAMFSPALSPKTVLSALRQLEDEDPLLGVEWNSALEEIHIHILGTIQLEVLEQLLRERFQLEVTFGDCETVYRETIAGPVTGYGHFEPLRHYAEVHLRLEPGKRGSGVTFATQCSADQLAGHYQRLIETHVMEKRHKGVLTGSELTDVKITLLAGQAHLKHTEGGDFREATYRAIRQGLMQAQSVLLEPYYRFRILAPTQWVGRVLSDIQRFGGNFQPPRQEGDNAEVCGRVPASKFINYSRDLTAFTGGKGALSVQFDGFEPCMDAEKVVACKGYNPDRDVENTADSVFCAKGAGYPVKWYDVEKCVHIR